MLVGWAKKPTLRPESLKKRPFANEKNPFS